jgi:predicted phosphoribosyltransferase
MAAGRLIEDISLRDKRRVFKDRTEAGKLLALRLKEESIGEGIVLAIPSGGVPVAVEIARGLSLPLDLLIVRKIQVPWNAEAGFGAVDPEGVENLNRGFIRMLGLTEMQVRQQVEKTMSVIRRRERIFRGDTPFPRLEGMTAIVVDDGLASGYTMMSALKFIKRKNTEKIIAAVPTAHDKTVDFILPHVDRLICPNVRGGFSFAVADAYECWYDLKDEEVVSITGLYRKEGGRG